MMKKIILLTVLTAGLFACDNSHDDMYDPNWVREQYNNHWKMNIGEIDPNHTWNMAKQVVAQIDVCDWPSKDYIVKVYSSNPLSSDCKLLAEKKCDAIDKLFFDVIDGQKKVFVTIEGEQGLVVNGYFQIINNSIEVISRRIISRAVCETQAGEVYLREGSVWNNDLGKNLSYAHKFSHLNNVYYTEGDTWIIGDYLDIIGNNGAFSEYGVGVNGKTESNLEKWESELGKEVVYTTTKDGPVSLSLNYGATQGDGLFGYYYYTDGEDPNDAIRYVLLSSTNPCNHIKYNGEYLNNNMMLGNIQNLDPNAEVTGTKYSLVYFSEDGSAHFDFPSNTHIVFFLSAKDTNGQVDWNKLVNSSKKDIVYNPYTSPGTMAVTYNYNGATFMGVEDGADDDMNDLLFFVTGNVSKPTDIAPVLPVPEPQSWTIACEDLGSIGDFDFNDVVFRVSHVSGSSTATVTPLAAGGTMAVNLYYGSNLIGEIHDLLDSGADVTKMINTGLEGEKGYNVSSLTPIEINVDDSFSMTSNMGDFNLKVVNGNGVETTKISGYTDTGNSPQMICVPGDWRWPREWQSIVSAYEDFDNWSADGSFSAWYTNSDSEYLY